MYLKQLAAFGMSAVMMLSGGVVASGAETKNDSETTLVTPYEYSAAVETLAASGVAAGSATALQAADGLRLAQESGALEEAWCIGTAAVISPIGELSWGDRDYKVNDNKIGALSQKLYDELTGIQWGTKPDPFGWVCPID